MEGERETNMNGRHGRYFDPKAHDLGLVDVLSLQFLHYDLGLQI